MVKSSSSTAPTSSLLLLAPSISTTFKRSPLTIRTDIGKRVGISSPLRSPNLLGPVRQRSRRSPRRYSKPSKVGKGIRIAHPSTIKAATLFKRYRGHPRVARIIEVGRWHHQDADDVHTPTTAASILPSQPLSSSLQPCPSDLTSPQRLVPDEQVASPLAFPVWSLARLDSAVPPLSSSPDARRPYLTERARGVLEAVAARPVRSPSPYTPGIVSSVSQPLISASQEAALMMWNSPRTAICQGDNSEWQSDGEESVAEDFWTSESPSHHVSQEEVALGEVSVKPQSLNSAEPQSLTRSTPRRRFSLSDQPHGENSFELLPKPLAGRPFWMPPSSPAGLKPRYPPTSSPRHRVRCDSPARRHPDVNIQAWRTPQKAKAQFSDHLTSIDTLEDSELPYINNRTLVSSSSDPDCSSPLRTSHLKAPLHSSSPVNWQSIVTSSSSTLSEAAYAAKALRRRERRSEERIYLTDDDMIEADYTAVTDSEETIEAVEAPNHKDSARGYSFAFQLQQDTPALCNREFEDISPLLDTSRTDIDLAEVSEGDADVAEEINEDCERAKSTSWCTFGHGGFSPLRPSCLSSNEEDVEQEESRSMELIMQSGFALTTPSDEGLERFSDTEMSLPTQSYHQERDSVLENATTTDWEEILTPKNPSVADGIPPSTSAPECMNGLEVSFSAFGLGLVIEGVDINQLTTSTSHPVLPSPRSLSPTPPASTLPARGSFIPRPFLLRSSASSSNERGPPSTTATPRAPRSFLLTADKAIRCSPCGSIASNPRTSFNSCASTTISCSPPLSLRGYLQYSPPESLDGNRTSSTSMFSSISVRSPRSSSRNPPMRKSERRSPYVVYPPSLSTQQTTSRTLPDSTSSLVSDLNLADRGTGSAQHQRTGYRPTSAAGAFGGPLTLPSLKPGPKDAIRPCRISQHLQLNGNTTISTTLQETLALLQGTQEEPFTSSSHVGGSGGERIGARRLAVVTGSAF